MRNSFIAAILAGITLGFASWLPSEAHAGQQGHVRYYRSADGRVYYRSFVSSPSKNRNGKKAKNSRRARFSSRNRVYKSYSYRIRPGSSSGSFSSGPSSSGSGKPSTSEFLVWPNGN
jgi:hypothetical protein